MKLELFYTENLFNTHEPHGPSFKKLKSVVISVRRLVSSVVSTAQYDR